MTSLTEIKQLGITHKLSNCNLTRIEVDDSHYYYIENEDFPGGAFCASVTSVIDQAGPVPIGLREYWKKNTYEESEEAFRKAGERGSKLHNALEELLNTLEVNLKKDYLTSYEKEAIVTFIRFFKFLQPSKFKSELVVASPSIRLAGTLDFIGLVQQNRLIMLQEPLKYLELVDDQFVAKPKYAHLLDEEQEEIKLVIDWKFSSAIRYGHLKQVIAYRDMYNESYANEKTVSHCAIWHFNPKRKFNFEFKNVTGTFESFKRLYDVYLDINDGEIPEPKDIVVYPDKVKLLEVSHG